MGFVRFSLFLSGLLADRGFELGLAVPNLTEFIWASLF